MWPEADDDHSSRRCIFARTAAAALPAERQRPPLVDGASAKLHLGLRLEVPGVTRFDSRSALAAGHSRAWLQTTAGIGVS